MRPTDPLETNGTDRAPARAGLPEIVHDGMRATGGVAAALYWSDGSHVTLGALVRDETRATARALGGAEAYALRAVTDDQSVSAPGWLATSVRRDGATI